MLRGFQYWILTLIGGLCVALVILNMFLFTGNRTRQAEISARGQYIQQSVQLQGLYQQIVRGLADLSVRNKDPQLHDLLARQGINVTVNAQPASGASSSADEGSSAGSSRKSRRP
jgi:hypothetical protein